MADARERASKVDPAYTEGELVRVAGSRNEPEADLIQGMLLEQGIPSMQRRTRGFDVPDYLAGGPRDVLVPASGARAAWEILHAADMEPPPLEGADPGGGHGLRLLAVVIVATIAAGLLVWLLLRAGA